MSRPFNKDINNLFVEAAFRMPHLTRAWSISDYLFDWTMAVMALEDGVVKREELDDIEQFAKYIDRASQSWDGSSLMDLYQMAHALAKLEGNEHVAGSLEQAIVTQTIKVLKGG